ncbi:glycosyltransferase family 4 protein [Prosthecochloris sp. CIB 2401]|uniref:glycosyltransferase family 4 protein n=1 Tax=Prosthecochloris sp. CIB 2401 TaxID=1868325 RepID=UPI00080AB658|nr:glycosyltransferase family 1 protein [Prosthecochloris sp. CIB 2401]ANT65720.1 GDP-mannose-dependent alpha-mannosyltransferase [Prosthecochloris sp. CIB 2401]
MKIAFYAGTYVKNKDGAVRSMYQLVASFLKAGHEVRVWSPDVNEQDSYSHRVVKMPSVPIPLYPDYKLGFYFSGTEQELDSFAPDIVHIATPDIIGYNFLRYANKRRLPVGSVYHTDFPSYLSYYRIGFLEPVAWRYLRSFYNRCDILFVPSPEMKAKLAGQGIQRMGMWTRGIDRELFSPARRSDTLREAWGVGQRVVIAYAGRFVWYKDIQVVMDVYRKFSEGRHADDVLFVMIGSGPEEDELRRQMPDAVFPGYLSGEALPEAYASSDIFLFPSTTEAFGNVVLEAASAGLPAVVSDEGGCKGIIGQSGSGFVVPARDADAFYAQCVALLEDRSLYEDLRQRGLAYAGSQSWDVINGKVIDTYLELVDRH